MAEAMAAGCYVITMPKSGSIVRDGVHGRVVPVDEHEALAIALAEAPDQRGTPSLVGRANADAFGHEYLVEDYTERVDQFYWTILERGPRGRDLR